MTSDIKLYYVINGWKKKHSFFSKYCHIIYNSKGLSLLIILISVKKNITSHLEIQNVFSSA